MKKAVKSFKLWEQEQHNQPEKVTVDTADIDPKSLEFEDIDPKDHPDYTDAYISYAEFKDGTPLNDQQLDALNDDSDYKYEELMNYLY